MNRLNAKMSLALLVILPTAASGEWGSIHATLTSQVLHAPAPKRTWSGTSATYLGTSLSNVDESQIAFSEKGVVVVNAEGGELVQRNGNRAEWLPEDKSKGEARWYNALSADGGRSATLDRLRHGWMRLVIRAPGKRDVVTEFQMKGRPTQPGPMSFSVDGKTVTCSYRSGATQVNLFFNASDGTLEHTLDSRSAKIKAVSGREYLRLEDGKLHRMWLSPVPGDQNVQLDSKTSVLSFDAKRVAGGDGKPELRVAALNRGGEVLLYRGVSLAAPMRIKPPPFVKVTTAVALSEDGATLGVGYQGGVLVYETGTGKLLASRPIDGFVQSLVLASGKLSIAAAVESAKDYPLSRAPKLCLIE